MCKFHLSYRTLLKYKLLNEMNYLRLCSLYTMYELPFAILQVALAENCYRVSIVRCYVWVWTQMKVQSEMKDPLATACSSEHVVCKHIATGSATTFIGIHF